ncbi:pirin family protein [Nocardioides campestrisoli]|uniref:pirin family protein n=1 Tax=Nocardioides campestrisoli TaxID=2736757 RepID=UPI001CD76A0B|nr:pirin family protein [Nocardioides campestrisoli]
MTNPDPRPREQAIHPGVPDVGLEVLPPREVPLGGPRGMRVRRTLPQRHRSLIGAWCFLDHYGPDDVAVTGGMRVPAHPHTGLATVSWLFTGEIEHRDSTGAHARVVPGEFNLMTAGRGISHSEVSLPDSPVLHGVQLWLALPEGSRDVEPRFEHYAPRPVRGPGWEARVFLGSLLGDTSPVRTHSPLVGAELMLADGHGLEVDVDPAFEHGFLLDVGRASVEGQEVEPGELLYLSPGRDRLRVECSEEARMVLIGGPPFGEEIMMWWNFVGRTHEEIVEARDQWQAQLFRDDELVTDGTQVLPGRYGVVPGQHLPPLPAPTLPNARLKRRR